MRVNLYLFKKDISPKNLPIFTSAEDRETYFSESNADKTYKNISYNGTRNIRINENAFEANLDYYNYARINWTDKEDVEHNYYCFIDIVKYVNDNVSELQLTLDYVTTYYFDIKLNEFNLVQTNIPDKILNRSDALGDNGGRIDFENKYPCKYKPIMELHLSNNTPVDTSGKKINNRFIKWLIININPSDSDNISPVYQNNGTKVICIPFPVLLVVNDDGSTNVIQDVKLNLVYKSGSTVNINSLCLSDIFKEYAGRIINISMIDNYYDKDVVFVKEEIPENEVDNNIVLTNDNVYTDIFNATFKEINGVYFPFITKPIYTYNFSYIDFFNNLSSFYENFKLIKNCNEEILNIDLEDINYDKSLGVAIHIEVDPIFPNNIKLEFYNKIDDKFNTMFNKLIDIVIIPAGVSGIQFDVSKWDEYFIQNSASVSDGLATKHKYDLENANKQRQSSHIQGSLNFLGSSSSAISGILGAGITGNIGGILSGAGKAITSTTSYASNITATEYAYQIAENNIEKEKALLQIAWNDIKNAPNVMYNYGAGNNILTYIKETYKFVVYQPDDQTYHDMRYYHMMYGFKVNRKYGRRLNGNPMTLNDILTIYENEVSLDNINYKFIRLESDFVIDNLPLTARKMLSDIFKDGVKFYKKSNLGIAIGDTFNNYIR